MNKNILSVILVVAVFGCGFIVGRISGGVALMDALQFTSQNETKATTANEAHTSTEEGAINLGSQMTAEQRKMLESFGLNPDTITITPGMVACAEAKLGAARIAEIEGGSTPSFLEGVSLMGCFSE